MSEYLWNYEQKWGEIIKEFIFDQKASYYFERKLIYQILIVILEMVPKIWIFLSSRIDSLIMGITGR